MTRLPAIGPDPAALREHLIEEHGYDTWDVDHESTSSLTAMHEHEHARPQDHEHVDDEQRRAIVVVCSSEIAEDIARLFHGALTMNGYVVDGPPQVIDWPVTS